MTKTIKGSKGLIICLCLLLFICAIFVFAPKAHAEITTDCSKMQKVDWGMMYITDGKYYYDTINENGKNYFVVASSENNINAGKYKYKKSCASSFLAQYALSDKKSVLYLTVSSKNSNKYKINVLNLKTGKVQSSPYFTSYGEVNPLGIYNNYLYFNGIVKKGNTVYELDKVNINTGKTKYLKPTYGEFGWNVSQNGRYYYSAGNSDEYYIYDAKKGKVIRTLPTSVVLIGPKKITYSISDGETKKGYVAGLSGASPELVYEFPDSEYFFVNVARISEKAIFYSISFINSQAEPEDDYFKYDIESKETAMLTLDEWDSELYG